MVCKNQEILLTDMLTLWTFRSFGNDFNILSFLNKLDPCLGSLIFVQFVDFDKRIWTLKKVTHVTVLFQKETSKIDPIFLTTFWIYFEIHFRSSDLKFLVSNIILDPFSNVSIMKLTSKVDTLYS